jgi:hypothetical protein
MKPPETTSDRLKKGPEQIPSANVSQLVSDQYSERLIVHSID